MKNSLHESISRFTNLLKSFINKEIEEGSPLLTYDYIDESTGELKDEIGEPVIDWARILSERIHRILETSEAEELGKLLLENGYCRDIKPWWSDPENLNIYSKNTRAILGTVLIPYFRYLRDFGSIENIEQFVQFFLEKLKSLKNVFQTYHVVVPLYGLQFPYSYYKLSNTLSVVEINDVVEKELDRGSVDYKSYFTNQNVILESRDIKYLTHALRGVYQLPYSERHDLAELSEIDLALNSLILWRNLVFKAPAFFMFSGDTLDPSIITYGSIQEYSARHFGHFKTEIMEEELEFFAHRFNLLSEAACLKTNRPLFLAIKRFAKAFDRQDPADCIIDHSIALEATILHKIREELGYRLGLRAAVILEDHSAAAKLRTLYNVRSKIVHDGLTITEALSKEKIEQVKKELPEVYIRSIRDLTRQVLNQILDRVSQGKSLEEICQDIDRSIVEKVSGKLG